LFAAQKDDSRLLVGVVASLVPGNLVLAAAVGNRRLTAEAGCWWEEHLVGVLGMVGVVGGLNGAPLYGVQEGDR